MHRALTDFTQERLHIWNRTLDPKTYELREHGPNWAVARESTPRSPFRVVARYDWSDPAVVRWTVVESSYRGGGHGFVRIAPRNGGGSRSRAEWVNTKPRRQKLMLLLLHLVPDRMIARIWAAALGRYALAQDTRTERGRRVGARHHAPDQPRCSGTAAGGDPIQCAGRIPTCCRWGIIREVAKTKTREFLPHQDQ